MRRVVETAVRQERCLIPVSERFSDCLVVVGAFALGHTVDSITDHGRKGILAFGRPNSALRRFEERRAFRGSLCRARGGTGSVVAPGVGRPPVAQEATVSPLDSGPQEAVSAPEATASLPDEDVSAFSSAPRACVERFSSRMSAEPRLGGLGRCLVRADRGPTDDARHGIRGENGRYQLKERQRVAD